MDLRLRNNGMCKLRFYRREALRVQRLCIGHNEEPENPDDSDDGDDADDSDFKTPSEEAPAPRNNHPQKELSLFDDEE